MKKVRTVIILAVILVALTAVLLVLGLHNRTDEVAEDIAVAVGGITNADSITYTASDGQTLTFVRDSDTWYYAEDKDFPVGQTYVTRIAEIVNNCTAERAFYGADLTEYGLNDPQKTLTVTGDGKTVTFELSTTTGGVCYASIGNGNVYVLKSDLTSLIGLDLMTVITSEAMPKAEEAQISAISMRCGDVSAQFTSAKDNKQNITWYVMDGSDKVKATDMPDVDGVSVMAYLKNMLSALKNMRPNGVAAYKSDDLAKFGLDVPLTISVDSTGNSGNYNLLVGRTDSGYFVTVPGSTCVYKLHETLAEPIYAAFDAIAK